MIEFSPGTAFAVDPAIIPVPAAMQQQDGVFVLQPDMRIRVDAATLETGRLLAAVLGKSTGFTLQIVMDGDAAIVLTTADAKGSLGSEGYELAVSPDSLVIRAPQPAGAFYGVQSLLQLLPPEVFSPSIVNDIEWKIPCVRIEDQPRFPWRGLMLDVSRHFFDTEEIKQLLDSMAMQKLNTLHWHLVDDNGWRIEIEKYPLLTQVGAWRKDVGFGLDAKATTAYGPDGRYGGFYTQDDIREIVAYAQSRHINIVPEIEMPGHSIAALSAYPELSCSGGPYSTDIGAGIHAGVYCAGQDESFAFLQDVLTEIFDLFPSKTIHIGGDEVPKDNWKACPQCQARMKAEGLKNEHELQSYFIRRIEKFINANHRNLIGWSEIREGGLAENAAVMDWIGGAVEAAGSGHDVVMSPTSHCYFDYYQSQDLSGEPRAIGGYLPLSTVYSFEPVPENLPPDQQNHILGAQGNVWTEYIPSLKQVEYMTYPRLTALAEVTWSPAELRRWDDFCRRLQTQYRRFDLFGVHYRRETSTQISE